MRHRHGHGRWARTRRLMLLLALACGVGLTLLPHLSNRAASAQSAPVHEIAFERNDQIFVMNADGVRQPRLLEPHADDPAWSPDASRIAFNTPFGEVIALWSIDAAGTQEKQQISNFDTDPEGHHNFDAAYSPDGQQLVYTRNSFVDNISRLYLIPAGGGVPVPLATGREESYDATWSPDGTKIAFASGVLGGFRDEDIYIVPVDGSLPAVRLTHDADGSRAPAFAPDGVEIAFSKDGDIYVVRPDGTNLTNLTNTPNLIEENPTWSPDSTRIAFSGRAAGGGAPFIYIMDGNGQNVVATGEAGTVPAWKPIPGMPSGRGNPTPTPTPSPTPTPTPTPVPETDIAVQLTAAPNPAAVGVNLTYTMTVKNQGPFAADSVRAVFLRPQSAEFVSSSPAQGVCAPGAGPEQTVCELGQIAGGAQTTIRFVVKPTAPGEIMAFSSATSPSPDSNPNNNGQQLAVNVNGSCVPEVTSEIQQLIVRHGNQSRKRVGHTIYVRNTSGRTLNGLIHFVFDGLNPNVQDGDPRSHFFYTRCAQPLDRPFKTVMRDFVWQPGQIIQLEVDFFNPDRTPINYNLRVYTGPGYP
jgi:uncharacterized repeat protein (TIGR01451 family)